MNDRMARLPLWAQDHIDTLERRLATAVHALQKASDDSTPSSISYARHDCTTEGGPTTRRFFVQSSSVEVIHRGVHVRLFAFDNENIRIQYGESRSDGIDYLTSAEVALVPVSHQYIQLVHRSFMRA